ncbi:hypothetical protein PILCRDRAFT_118346 [Piloderma croceum F 1598]|uniref:Uncharacterized protein n=1 Tax=Piloderma croceum (strain F 1598) TaxID=765440 RepID=A0A0C3CRM2_PILCF|nr:hypothetical protein PILCRDRAFT_118346 [Piloderma croceum F 1598]
MRGVLGRPCSCLIQWSTYSHSSCTLREHLFSSCIDDATYLLEVVSHLCASVIAIDHSGSSDPASALTLFCRFTPPLYHFHGKPGVCTPKHSADYNKIRYSPRIQMGLLHISIRTNTRSRDIWSVYM